MAIQDPPKADSPFCDLQTGGWNPETPEINNFFIPEITIRGGYTTGGQHGRIWPFVTTCRIYQEMIGLEQFGRRGPDGDIRFSRNRLDFQE